MKTIETNAYVFTLKLTNNNEKLIAGHLEFNEKSLIKNSLPGSYEENKLWLHKKGYRARKAKLIIEIK